MAKKKIKIVRVPGTTANITKGIVNFLRSEGHWAFRAHNVGIYDEKRKAFRRSNAEPGIPDILCCLKYSREMTREGVGTMRFNCGLFMGIEVKNEATGDRMRKNQEAFAQAVKASNGLYITTPTLSSFVTWYNQNVKSHAGTSPQALPG